MFDLNNLEVVKLNKPKPNEFQIHLLATELFYGIQEFYSNPENMKRFEEWEKKRENERRAKDARKTTKNSP